MAKKKTSAKNEIQKVTPTEGATALARPDWMQKQTEIKGVEALTKFVVPPFLKIVQKQASDDLLERFNRGDVILNPQQTLVAAFNESDPEKFFMVPLFFYVEACQWTPFAMKGQVPMILKRSTDPGSDLYRKSEDRERWEEEVEYEGKKFTVRNVQHLNFVACLLNHDFSGMPIIISFSKGEHKTGRNLSNLVKMRKANIFDCVFQLRVNPTPRENAKGTWYGFEITNPDPNSGQSPWTSEEQHNEFENLFLEFTKVHEGGRLRAEYDETPEEDPDNEEL